MQQNIEMGKLRVELVRLMDQDDTDHLNVPPEVLMQDFHAASSDQRDKTALVLLSLHPNLFVCDNPTLKDFVRSKVLEAASGWGPGLLDSSSSSCQFMPSFNLTCLPLVCTFLRPLEICYPRL